MKKQFVAKLQEGDKVNDYFVATRKDLRDTQSGGKFLGMVFKDRTGEIGGVQWNNAVSAASLFEVGDVVNVRGTVTSYQSRLQIRVDQALPIKEDEYSLADLVAAPDDSDTTLDSLKKVLETVHDESLAALLNAFLNDSVFMGQFVKAAAGKRWHHAYPGGLLRHTYEVARIAEGMCELFPNIDHDLLLTAVFMHDIGKIEEMSHDLFVDYTNAGKLIGHLIIGVEMVRKKIETIPGFPEKLQMQIIHCILSHHGELTNGSPIVPKTLEAVVLSHCDNLDAQTEAITRVVRETKDNHQAWSEYLQPIERMIWTKEG